MQPSPIRDAHAVGRSPERMSRPSLGRIRSACAAFCLALCLSCMWLLPTPTTAQSAPEAAPDAAVAEQWRPLTFSRLVLRIRDAHSIGIGSDEYRVFILEALRARGLSAVGAENLVFDIDKSGDAELALGGTVTELQCRDTRRGVEACRIGIHWQLLELASQEIVYEVKTWGASYHVYRKPTERVGRELVMGALDACIRRTRFRRIVWRPTSGTDQPALHYAPTAYHACRTNKRPFPASSEQVLPATLMVELESGHGSAFLINGEGLVLTAAHVIKGKGEAIRLRSPAGTEYAADLLRVNKQADAALLRIENLAPGTRTPCLAVNLSPKSVGSEVFAVGAPASKQLAFSITKGIVSGVRYLEDNSFIQTDASINPGNSGGPLLNSDGEGIGLISWKVAGTAFEGIAFAVPIEVALERLGLRPHAGDTAPELLTGAPIKLVAKKARDARDADGPVPSLDPKGDALRAKREAERARRAAEAQRERERNARLAAVTPAYIPMLRYGGLILAAGGLGAVVYGAASLEERPTRDNYQHARLANDLGWIALGAGSVSVIASYLLAPSLPPDEHGRTRARQLGGPRMRLSLGPAALAVLGAF